MADNPITTPLPADLPEQWTYGQTVGPNGTDVGLTEQHGYNYLMRQVNATQEGVNALGEAFAEVPVLEGGKVPVSQLPVGTPNGVAGLDSAGKVPSSQLPDMDYVPLSGGTMTGPLVLPGDPTASLQAAPKQYVDNALNDITPSGIGAAPASHTHEATDITSGVLPVANGGTGAATFASGYALIGAGTGAVTTRTIRNNTATSSAITADTALITSNTLRYAINRTTSVAAANTAYTTLIARGSSLNSAETTPAVNGAIAWTYE